MCVSLWEVIIYRKGAGRLGFTFASEQEAKDFDLWAIAHGFRVDPYEEFGTISAADACKSAAEYYNLDVIENRSN